MSVYRRVYIVVHMGNYIDTLRYYYVVSSNAHVN